MIYEQAWKYVRDATGTETLYDLDADPGETAGAGADAPRASLRRQLAQALEHRRNQLSALILANDRSFTTAGRGWTGSDYTVPTRWQSAFRRLDVIGDKKGGQSTRQLRDRPGGGGRPPEPQPRQAHVDGGAGPRDRARNRSP